MKNLGFAFPLVMIVSLGLVVFITAVPVKTVQYVLLDKVEATQLSTKQANILKKHPDMVPVRYKNEQGEIDTTFVLATRIEGKNFPIKLNVHLSTCGCETSNEVAM
jgi:hypothetical protein